MVKLIKYGFVFIWFILAISVHAQVYPVSGNAVLVPPYSVYLADYTSPTSDRLISNIVLNDASRPDLRVRLRIKITGQNISLETKPEYIGREIVLEGGTPLRLTGIDLAEYFNPNNLNFSGITRRTFEQTGALPQGFYQFCIEVLEYNRGVKISNTICAPGWLILNDPPIINLPRNGEKLKPLQPQNVVFQWTPRHTGSPNSAFTTEYDIKLVEIWPANRNPNDAILTSPPILEATTRSTTFIYDVSQTPLELGRNYALQVKAKSLAGVDELDLFKNNGRSEVITFTYGDPCDIPGNITAQATSATRFTVNWLGTSNHTGYRVEYRQANNATAPWYSTNALTTDVGISALKPDTKYEYRVAGTCGVFESVFSSVGVITTKTSGETGYACGLPLEPFNLDPSQLINTLKVGDVIDAGDFEVVLAKVSGSGTFSGEGVIEMPFFNKARVKAEFTSIQVNKDMRMVSGHMNVTGAAVEVIPAGVMDFMDNLSEVLTGLDSALTNIENNLPKPFDEHAFVPDTTLTLAGPVIINKAPDGSVVITDNNGKTHTLPPSTEAAVIDDKGNATLVDNTGKPHSVPLAVAQAAANREYNLKLTFAEAKTNQRYGFDALDEPNREVFNVLANRYTKLESEYYIPYKSVETGNTDVVVGVLAGSGVDKSKIRFEKGGVPVPSTPFSGTESTVTISANGNGEEEALIAVLPAENESQKDQVLGRVDVVSYNKINKNLVIIPVNNNAFTATQGTDLQTELNKIYGQAVVGWSVTVRSAIQVEGISPFDVGSSGLLSNYTNHMKDVIKAYKDNMKDGDDFYYLFLVNNPSDPKIAGVMPRSKNAGFIFMEANNSLEKLSRTVAHELGHGVFNLHHTFMEENHRLLESETDNLMDYAGGTKLYKYQWDMMRYPPIVMGVFESDEEAASEIVTNELIEMFLSDLRESNSKKEKRFNVSVYSTDVYVDYSTTSRDLDLDGLKLKYLKTTIVKFPITETNRIPLNIRPSQKIKSEYIESQQTFVKYQFNLLNVDNDTFYPSWLMQNKFLLEFNILKEDEAAFESYIYATMVITLYDGDTQKDSGSYLYITDGSPPVMPDVRVKITGTGSKFNVKITIVDSVFFAVNANSDWMLRRAETTSFPETDWYELENGSIWDVNFGTSFRGGKAYIIAQDGEEIKKTVFHIRGRNPTQLVIRTYLESLTNGTAWYFPKMLRQESTFRQFANGEPGLRNGSPVSSGQRNIDKGGRPLWGYPYGWGLKQLDLLGGEYGYLTTFNNRWGPFPDEIWNWQANIRKGVQFFNEEKMGAAQNTWDDALDRITDWERTNPTYTQDNYPMLIVQSLTAAEVNTTITGNMIIGLETFSSHHRNIPPGNRSLKEADALKYYNGGRYYSLNITANSNTGVVTLPVWRIDKTQSRGGSEADYVLEISNANGW